MNDYLVTFSLHRVGAPDAPMILVFSGMPTVEAIIRGFRSTCRDLDLSAVDFVLRRDLNPKTLASIRAKLEAQAKSLDWSSVQLVDDGTLYAFQLQPLRDPNG